MSCMSADILKKTTARGAAACALALALACALPGAAQAEYLPEGSGELDVSVLTDVLPTVDAEARLNDVNIHVSNDAGEDVAAASVRVRIAVPNDEEGAMPITGAEADDAEAESAEQAASLMATDAEAPSRHAVSASGTTEPHGRIRLAGAAVGATYVVEVSEGSHYDFSHRFTCAGDEGETWEVVMRKVPNEPLPGGDGGNGGTDGAGGDGGAGGASGDGGAGGADAQQIMPLPKPLSWLLQTGDPLGIAAALAAAACALLAAALMLAARRRSKEDARHA